MHMLLTWIAGPWLTAPNEPGFSPEELATRWGVPVGLVVAVVVLTWLISKLETLGRPVRWLLSRLRRQQAEATPSAVDLAAWATHLQIRMGELWVHGERAPLRAAEADSPSTLQHLAFQTDAALLHPSRRSAVTLATGEPIALDDNLSPGDLFALLDYSVLVVGAPGAGKSVLLWQMLRDRLADTDDASTAMPVLIELHRWPTIDSGDGPVPAFEEFVVAELGAPAVGVPSRHVRALIAQDQLIYLLDGLDELPEEYGLRCLRALASFAQGAGQRPLRRLALTSRQHDYTRLVERRQSGTSAVANALRITPLSPHMIEQAFALADPSPGRLPEAARRLPELSRMLGTPLWLSIAEAVYQQDPSVDLLEELPADADAAEIAAKLYPRWLALRLPLESAPLEQLGFLAAAMRANRQGTLYLEALQPTWLAWTGLSRTARTIASLIAGLSAGLAGVLSHGPVFGLVDGLMQGCFYLLGGGLLFWWYSGEKEAFRVVADRSWSWRATVSSRSLITLALGACVGLGLWALGLEVAFGRRLGYGSSGLRVWAAFGLSGGLIAGPLANAWTITPAIEGRSSRPMDVLRRSVGHGLAVGVAYGLALVVPIVVTMVWFYAVYGGGPFAYFGQVQNYGMILGLILLMGIVFGIHFGLGAGLGHAVTRVTTAYREFLPLRLVAVLDEASARGVMYPVGPGYRFRHRTLADHLADVYVNN
jgi:hypothetical protein